MTLVRRVKRVAVRRSFKECGINMDAHARYFDTGSSGDDKLRLVRFLLQGAALRLLRGGLKQVSGKDRRTTELSATARARSTAAR